jgi:hypothetical protein
MPGWRPFGGGYPAYDPRVVFDSGRVYFQSSDALVPQDTNSQQDVYEYEPAGIGTCTESIATFTPTAGGCVSLISSGVSPQESVFYDASETGNDVFFSTSAQLSWTDIDEATDVYDARVGGGRPEPVKPPACEGDACQGTASSPIDETPSSLAYHGPGNVKPTPTPSGAPTEVTVRKHGRKDQVLNHGRCLKACKHKQAKKATRGAARRGAVVNHKRGGGR